METTTLKINSLPEPADTASIGRGERMFGQFCGPCHGGAAVGGGVTPDLRGSALLSSDVFYDVVLKGILKDAGMVSFKSALSHDDVTGIRNYIIHRANQDASPPPLNKTH
jgi:alcohol dehydrogenase (cytochrome c)/quinohemoprotein ethanol dehydrogenase